MIKMGEIDGRKAFLLPNGDELSKLASAAISSITKPDFFPKPAQKIYLLSIQLFIADAEAKLKYQAGRFGVESEHVAITRSALDTLRNLMAKILDPNASYSADELVETNNLRENKVTKLALRDTLINYICYVEISINDKNFVRDVHTKTVEEKKIQQFPQFDPVMKQVAKVFSPKLFQHLGFTILLDVESQSAYILSRSFINEADARKYLQQLQRNFPSAVLKLDHKNFRLHIPNLDQRLQDVTLGLQLRSACADAKPYDAEFTNLVERAKQCGCLNHAGDGTDKTALHRAVISGNLQKAQALLEAGADATLKDKAGNTASHYAALQNNAELSELMNHEPRPGY